MSQINRVLNNLIINAIHSIKSKYKDNLNGVIEIIGYKEERFLKIKIIDNGPGLAHDEKDLLRPYFSTKDKKLGTGLGLSIVEKIISEHGGNFHIYNVKNMTGACSEFTLKLHNE